MPIALFVAGNVWLVAALALVFGSKVARTQPLMYAFLDENRSGSFYPSTYYTWVTLLFVAAVICFVLSFVAWRRQHNQPMQWPEAAGAFPVIPASGDRGPGH